VAMTKTLAAVTAASALLVALTGCTLPLEAAQGGLLDKPSAADDAAAKADIANAKLAATSYVVSNGTAPTSVGDLAGFGYTQSAGVTNVAIRPGTGTDVCIEAQSSTGTYFHAAGSASVSEGRC
jgi:hypothetical protein